MTRVSIFALRRRPCAWCWHVFRTHERGRCPDCMCYAFRCDSDGTMLHRPNPFTTGSNNGNWRGDEITYAAAHLRARRVLRGRACLGCGTTKIEASLIAGRGTRLDESKDRWYSPDPSDYQPRCHRCHHAYDNLLRPRDNLGKFAPG